MSKHEFAIPVHDLDAAGRQFSLPVRPAWLRATLEDTDVRPADGEGGEIDVRLSKSGRDVVVRGRVAVRVVTPCARCLEPAIVRVDEDLTALAVRSIHAAAPVRHERGRAGEDDDGESGGEDADSIPYDGETVVLDDLVRDQILMGIPMIPLCSEACPGISPPVAEHGRPQAGSTAVVDPRLLPLLSVKKN